MLNAVIPLLLLGERTRNKTAPGLDSVLLCLGLGLDLVSIHSGLGLDTVWSWSCYTLILGLDTLWSLSQNMTWSRFG